MDLDVSQGEGPVNSAASSSRKSARINPLRTFGCGGANESHCGIIQQDEQPRADGLPGLSQIPILGKLFSGENNGNATERTGDCFIPHIVRGPDVDDGGI